MSGISIHSSIDAVLAAGTREAAAAEVERMVAELEAANPDEDPVQIKKILLSNIGYYAGYHDQATADRIYELFDTEHPFFGRRHPTMEEALACGVLHAYLEQSDLTPVQRDTAQSLAAQKQWPELLKWILGKTDTATAPSAEPRSL